MKATLPMTIDTVLERIAEEIAPAAVNLTPVKEMIDLFIHKDCKRSDPSTLGFKIKGIKGDYHVDSINFQDMTVTVKK